MALRVATYDTPCVHKTLHAHYILGSLDWYIAELDSETGRAFVYCPGFPGEWGYDLVEMVPTVGPWNVTERDLPFKPTSARELDLP